MDCGQWTYYEPGSEPDQCGVTVRYGMVFECNACKLTTRDARIAELDQFIIDTQSRLCAVIEQRDAKITDLKMTIVAMKTALYQRAEVRHLQDQIAELESQVKRQALAIAELEARNGVS